MPWGQRRATFTLAVADNFLIALPTYHLAHFLLVFETQGLLLAYVFGCWQNCSLEIAAAIAFFDKAALAFLVPKQAPTIVMIEVGATGHPMFRIG
jgi:hypothetical protein